MGVTIQVHVVCIHTVMLVTHECFIMGALC